MGDSLMLRVQAKLRGDLPLLHIRDDCSFDDFVAKIPETFEISGRFAVTCINGEGDRLRTKLEWK